MTDTQILNPDDVHAILDQIQPGDHLTVTRTNADGTLTATASGPALVAQPTVAIDLLDGRLHIVRRGYGQVWGDFTRVMVTRDGELFGAEYVPAKGDSDESQPCNSRQGIDPGAEQAQERLEPPFVQSGEGQGSDRPKLIVKTSSAPWSDHMHPLRVHCQCPDCLKLWWRQFHPGGVVHHGGRPRAICPACQAARDFATLPWWRKMLTRIGGRR